MEWDHSPGNDWIRLLSGVRSCGGVSFHLVRVKGGKSPPLFIPFLYFVRTVSNLRLQPK